jgi:hypothetical protein
MGWKRAIMEIIELRLLNTVEIPQIESGAITLGDHQREDWAGILPVVEDPTEDSLNTNGNLGKDLVNLYLAHDETYLYGLMTMADGGPYTGALYSIQLQQYLYQLHTPGDIAIIVEFFGYGAWGITVGDLGPGGDIASYGPEYVDVGDGWIEWKVRLDDLKNIPGTPYPYYPAAPGGDRGIENRFIRAIIHDETDPIGVSDTNWHLTRPMIINFYPPGE